MTQNIFWEGSLISINQLNRSSMLCGGNTKRAPEILYIMRWCTCTVNSWKTQILRHIILTESNTPRCKFSPKTYLILSNSSPSGQPQFPHNILKLVQIIIIELNIFWSRWDAPAILAQTKLWSRKGLVCIIGLEFYASWVLCVVNSVVNFIIKL